MRNAELSSHPIRDIWLLRNSKWNLSEKAVAWEEISAEDDKVTYEVEVCVFCFLTFRDGLPETHCIRGPVTARMRGDQEYGGAESTRDYIKANPKDIPFDSACSS